MRTRTLAAQVYHPTCCACMHVRRWEVHYWARSYDRAALEYNANVIEQLHKVAREDHEQIVSRVATDMVPQLDKLQARTLHGKPFGHRCVRSYHVSK